MVKREMTHSCTQSYTKYKIEKKITLDDAPLNKEEEPEKIDYTEKVKKKKDDLNSAANLLKVSMPYAQESTRK